MEITKKRFYRNICLFLIVLDVILPNHLFANNLIDSIKKGNFTDFKSLISSGFDLNSRDKYDYTPLYWAIKMHRNNFVKELIQNGCDINLKFDKCHTALSCACSNNNIYAVKQLIKNEAKINVKGYYNMTPLHAACMYGHYDVAKILITNGASLNEVDIHRRTPLIEAIFHADWEIAALLIMYETDVKINDYKDRTALHYAAYLDYSSSAVEMDKSIIVAEMLIKAGADCYAKDKDGNTFVSLLKKNKTRKKIKLIEMCKKRKIN